MITKVGKRCNFAKECCPRNASPEFPFLQKTRYFVVRGFVIFMIWSLGHALSHPVQAQWQRDTLYRVLDEIEVTATKTPRTLSSVPGRVDVLSAETMNHIPATGIVDKLATVSGVNTRNSFGPITMRPRVTVRGLSGDEQSRTLVLVDGVPVNSSDTGGVNWHSINSSNVEQVEVFKGPGSSLYGSNAMGGIINVVTRTPQEPFSASAGLSYGTFSTFQSHLNVSSRITERLDVQLHGFYTESDGYNTIPDTARSLPEHQYRVPRYVEEGGINASATYAVNDLFKISAGYDLFLNKRGEGVEIEAPDGMYRNFDMNRVRFGIRGEQDDFRYHLNMFFQREDYFRVNERMRGDRYERFDVDSYRDDMGITLDLFQDVGANHTLTAGLETKVGAVDGGDFYRTSPDEIVNRGSMRFVAGYLQDEISLLDEQFHIQLGLRYDHVRFYDGFFEARGDGVTDFATYNGALETNSWSTLSPRTALRYNPNRMISGYVSYARGFRASILDDLTRSGWMWIGPKVANPNLGPEKLDNYEAGFDYRPQWRWMISPTFYYARGHDFLYYVETGDLLWGTRPVYRRENVSSVGIAGSEWDIRFVASAQLTLSANYTWHHAQIRSFPGRDVLEGNRLTYTPEHQAGGTLQWQSRWADIGFSMLYKSSQYADDQNMTELSPYVTFDIMVSRRFFDSLTATFEVMDMFDNRHMETLFHQSPGRFFNVKVVYDGSW